MIQKARTIEQWQRDREQSAPLESRLKRALIPAKFHDMRWSDYVGDAVVEAVGERENLKEVLRFYAGDWVEDSTAGIVLLGPPGYGKTCGFALLACELVAKNAFVRWTSFADLQKRKKALFGMARVAEESDDWEEHEREELRLRWIERDCAVLFLDDVGKEYRAASGWSDTELDVLLRTRTAAGKVTFINSNLRYNDWKTYNESMASFLHEVGEVLAVVEGTDHRLDVNDDSPRARRRRAGR